MIVPAMVAVAPIGGILLVQESKTDFKSSQNRVRRLKIKAFTFFRGENNGTPRFEIEKDSSK